jgi:ribosomal protein S18 acetylase RimI-like enzyme
MKIRSYTEEDYQFTHDLHLKNMLAYVDKYWGGWDSAIFRRDVCPESTWIVEYKVQKAGFFILNFESIAHLKNIQIGADFQNKGLGSKILKHCELESSKKGFDTLYLEAFLDNPARKLYERLGYETYDITKSHYQMKKELS